LFFVVSVEFLCTSIFSIKWHLSFVFELSEFNYYFS
jgi:hypothetical protein